MIDRDASGEVLNGVIPTTRTFGTGPDRELGQENMVGGRRHTQKPSPLPLAPVLPQAVFELRRQVPRRSIAFFQRRWSTKSTSRRRPYGKGWRYLGPPDKRTGSRRR